MKLLAVIRIRGRVNVNKDISLTLEKLKLKRPNNCVIINETSSFMGMLQKIRPYITWGEIDKEMLVTLIKKQLPNENAEEVANKILNGSIPLKVLNFPIKLAPPKKGFEKGGIKKPFNIDGVYGYRGEKINSLIRRML